jgi:excisionase family DNA binding protein
MGDKCCGMPWPAALTLSQACQYLSIEKAGFGALMGRSHILAVDLGDGIPRWRRSDLDNLLKRLPVLPQSTPASGTAAIHLDRKTIDEIVSAIRASLPSSDVSDMPRAGGVVSIKGAIKQLGLSRTTLYKMIADGTLEVRKIGKRTLVLQDSIDRLINGSDSS